MAAARKVLVAVANGSEDIETVSIIDVLHRAGLSVTSASVTGNPTVKLAFGTRIIADALIEQVQDTSFDAIVLPGGSAGADALRGSEVLRFMLERQRAKAEASAPGARHPSSSQGSRAEKAVIAAICASPAVVLAQCGFLVGGKKATCYPAKKFTDMIPHGQLIEDAAVVVEDGGNLITSKGPGTAITFALQIVSQLVGKDKAQSVAEGLLVAGRNVSTKDVHDTTSSPRISRGSGSGSLKVEGHGGESAGGGEGTAHEGEKQHHAQHPSQLHQGSRHSDE